MKAPDIASMITEMQDVNEWQGRKIVALQRIIQEMLDTLTIPDRKLSSDWATLAREAVSR